MKVHKQNMQVLKRRRQNLNASRSIMSTKVCLVIKVTIITGCIPLSEVKFWIYGFKTLKEDYARCELGDGYCNNTEADKLEKYYLLNVERMDNYGKGQVCID